MRRTEDKHPAVSAAWTVLMKSEFFGTWAGPEFSSKLRVFLVPYYCISTVRNLTFVCACAGPQNKHFSCTCCLHLAEEIWKFVCAWAGPKISFQSYLLLVPFWWNFFRVRRTENKLQAVTAAWLFWWNLTFVCACAGPKISFQLYLRLALLMGLTWISDICMRMRRTEDKLPAVPAAGAVDGPDLDIWHLFAHAQDRR